MKLSKMKRIMSAFMALIMICSLAACGNKQETSNKQSEISSESTNVSEVSSEQEDLYYNKTGYPICDEPITITVSGILESSATLDWNNTKLVKVIEEKLGIKLECSPIPKDAWNSQYALMLSTGDIPDLIINANHNRSQVDIDGASGFWLDMSQYMELMPNLQALFEKYPDFAASSKTENGNIYSLGRTAPSRSSTIYSEIYYDSSLTEAAGVGEINTVDDFYQALKLVKEAYPDKIPLGATFDKAPAYKVDQIIRTAFGIENYEAKKAQFMVDDNGKVYYADITDNNREYLKFMNKLYKEELLDNNCFIVTKDEYRANTKEGKYVFYSDSGMQITTADANAAKADPTKQEELYSKYSYLFALTSEYQQEKSFVLESPVLSQARIFINAETEYPEAICRLIDYFATEEGQWLATYGTEGEDFEFIDDGYGNKVMSQENFWDKENYKTIAEWQNNEIVISAGFPVVWGVHTLYLDDVSTATLEAMAKDPNVKNYYHARELLEFSRQVEREVVPLPPLSYTAEEDNEVGNLRTDLNNYLMQMKVNFITGESDPYNDKDWENYVNQVKAMGYDKLIAVDQAAYERLQSAMNN